MVSPSLLSSFLLLVFLSSSVSSSPIVGLDSFFAELRKREPSAINDTFNHLSSSIKRSLSNPTFLRTSQYLDFLSGLEITIPVEIVLVGFQSGHSGALISGFLSSIHDSDEFTVVSAGNPPSHRFSVKHKLQAQFPPSTPSLAASIHDAIRKHIDGSTSALRFSSLHPVPFSVVDHVISQDFVNRKHKSSGYVIYLLNLNPNSKPYAYTDSTSNESPGFSKCLGTVWMAKERYIWVDLAAGPVNYGPAISGEGVMPPGEFHPLAALHGRPKSEKTFLADISSLIWSAYRSLLAPSLRIPVYFQESLIVQFVHIYESGTKDWKGLDFGLIENTFMDEVRDGNLLVGSQKLKFEKYELKATDCPICTFATVKAMKSYTSRYLFENYTLIGSEYLDSKSLHNALSNSADQLRKLAKIPEEVSGMVIPIYVFDLEFDKVLMLDRYHQSVAFSDMVIAVRTRTSQSVADYNCNGRHVIVQARNLERPIVGSLLQSMWGVSPTHVRWSVQHNSSLIDYTWSVGQTPFGPFSDLMSLSFVQKDAAKRNVLLTTMNYTIMSMIDVVDSVAKFGGEKTLLTKNSYVEYVQRWNLLKFKLERVVSALSHLDFDTALYFMQSCENDLYAMHTLVYQASQALEATLECFKDPPFPWVSFVVCVVAVCGVLYVYSRRDRILRSKRKQF